MMERLLAHRELPVPSLRGARPDVPNCLDEIFQQMVAKQPSQDWIPWHSWWPQLEQAGLAPTNADRQLGMRVKGTDKASRRFRSRQGERPNDRAPSLC